MTPLTAEHISRDLKHLPAWQLEPEGRALRCEFRFADFIQAFGFMTQMAIVSESMNHHPEWSNVYNRLNVRLTTHDANGLSDLDMEWARRADATFLQIARRP